MKLIYTGDFERLKDFGFEYDEFNLATCNYKYWQYVPVNSIGVVQIDIKSRIIFMNDNIKQDGLIKIYDLIQAGLVKKEEEDE